MIVGDIIVNPWVSKRYNGVLNPIYATIYLGGKRSMDGEGRIHEWINKPSLDIKEWRVIGHCNLQTIINEAIVFEHFLESEESEDE